jgi:hypothetical protein
LTLIEEGLERKFAEEHDASAPGRVAVTTPRTIDKRRREGPGKKCISKLQRLKNEKSTVQNIVRKGAGAVVC